MPPLNEGDILYMPTTDPGLSITKARELVQQTDRIIMSFPEVSHVLGKVGRAETATDPAPLSMLETTITLKPESEWRPGMTMDKLIDEMDDAINFPGLTNAWTMPIKTRIDMLSTGIKTPIGVKVMGPDLQVLADVSSEIAAVLQDVPGTASAYPDKTVGGNFLDWKIDRLEAARYGLTVGDVQDVIMSAIGGMNVTQTVEGLERYPVNVRYSREMRDDLSALGRVLIPTPRGNQIPLSYVAEMELKQGPPVIKSENARRTAWIYVDIRDIDVGSYVAAAREKVEAEIDLPEGYSLIWSGQYEYMERAKDRLMIVIPLTLLVIFLLLYMNFRSVSESMLVMLSLPFALVGGIWLIWVYGFNLSVAVGVGFIALAGVAAEIGIIMLTYLDQAYKERAEAGEMRNLADLRQAIYQGTALRIRPIMMTVLSIVIGLLPILWGTGTGSEIMQRIAAPMVGGMISTTGLGLLVLPTIYYLWKGRTLRHASETPSD
jgi:Cu(I)/Ag(I) efflux system membrane protein CusA/SilA